MLLRAFSVAGPSRGGAAGRREPAQSVGRALLTITIDHRWLGQSTGHGTLDSHALTDVHTVRRWACDAEIVPVVLRAAHHIHHRVDGGATELDNLVLLCLLHHQLVHHGQRTVTISDGVPWLTPPPWIDPAQRPRPGGRPRASPSSRDRAASAVGEHARPGPAGPPSVPAMTTPTDDDVALVLGAYAAWERGDIDAAVAPLHPDVVWIEPEEFPNGGERHGPAAVADYLRASREGWRELHSQRRASVVDGDVVVVHRVRGTLLDGTAGAVDVADVFTVRDGRVVRMHATTDPAWVGA